MLSRRERIAVDGFLLAVLVAVAGWVAGTYEYGRTSQLLLCTSLLIVLVTAYRTVMDGLVLTRSPATPRIPVSEEVRRHAARQARLDPDA
ncbi:hypothetical protein K7B10_00170 [Streptomyces flavotricini]|uniref:Uncharacterized protein n=1 Tax=Streptomyces flavotricini TaxID=66888 RepID=A0ABS8DWT5_9ACTN|nr:hypothetical protein [Streptomyces flavotricini]MCC0093251.1 hypothetical protein [Streptomyces flavotricini]